MNFKEFPLARLNNHRFSGTFKREVVIRNAFPIQLDAPLFDQTTSLAVGGSKPVFRKQPADPDRLRHRTGHLINGIRPLLARKRLGKFLGRRRRLRAAVAPGSPLYKPLKAVYDRLYKKRV